MRKIYDWCLLKCRLVKGAIAGLMPKREFLIKVRKRVWRVAMVLGMLLVLCPVLFAPSMYTTGFSATDFTYTGSYSFSSDSNGDWRLEFLTSGIFTPKKPIKVDAFLLGGGSGGRNAGSNPGGGGSGGRTFTQKNRVLSAGTAYSITIGNGGAANTAGGNTQAFDYTANGGSLSASSYEGCPGGSGGGAGVHSGYTNAGVGGSNGSNGGASGTWNGGTGQGTTTREFGEAGGKLYAGGGGGGGGQYSGSPDGAAGGAGGGAKGGLKQGGTGYSAVANTGGGGGGAGKRNDGGAVSGGAGGSGICIIRNAR